MNSTGAEIFRGLDSRRLDDSQRIGSPASGPSSELGQLIREKNEAELVRTVNRGGWLWCASSTADME
jgi:hypothetical protein